jgi:Cell division GTPase
MGDRAVSFYGGSRGWTVSILLLSLGGGGGNILRSLKAVFRRDLLVTQKSDPKYAERLRRAISTRFIDTNEFSLSDVPRDERLLIGARTTGRLGARHNPEVARQALRRIEERGRALLSGYSVVIVIGTGGKGTGAGTMFPVVQMARQHKSLVIPIFVRPSFERHEVDKRRFDHALSVIDQFDKAQIRFIEILNDQGYADRHPEPQSVVWERMTLPIARGLRGLITCSPTCRRSTHQTSRHSWPAPAESASASPKSIRRPRRIRMVNRSRMRFEPAGRIRTTRSASRLELAGLYPGRMVERGRCRGSRADSPPLPPAMQKATRTIRSTPGRPARRSRGA